MTFPTSYDNDDLLFGDLHDQMSVTLSQGCLSVDTELFVESVTDITAPSFLWMEGELIKVTDVNVDSLIVERDPDIAIAHQSGTSGFVVIAAEHLNIIRDRAVQSQKYQGLVGNDAAKPASPSVTEVYLAVDTEKVYVCVVAGQWSLLGGATTHADVQREGETDDHPQYFTLGRLDAWHNSLTGEHVTDGDNHDHRVGTGVGRLKTATSTTLPSKGVGYIRLATDTGELYLGTGTSSWITVTGAPTGTIIMLQEADVALYGGCPSGWVRYTQLDGNFPKGAPSGSYGLGVGGSATHYHSYTQVPEHLHNVPQMQANTDSSGNHTHTFPFSTANSSTGMASVQGSTTGDPHDTTYSGDHTHAFNYPQVNTDTVGGGVAAYTDTQSSLPPYKEVLFCKKL